MSDLNDKLARFFKELKRRKTMQAAAAYIVAAWVLIEVASVVLPAFGLERVMPFVIIAFAIGLPIAVVVSWLFDLTPHGFERTDEIEDEEPEEAELPAALKPSMAVPLGTARRRQVSLLQATFELLDDGRPLDDQESLHALSKLLDEAVDKVAERYKGRVVARTATGCEIVFGYPVAFENDALRACAAAFALRDRVAALDAQNGKPVASISLHTATVVVEEGDDERLQIVGEAAQITGWLQSLVQPGCVVLSDACHKLVYRQVLSEPLGLQKNLRSGLEMPVFAASGLRPHEELEDAAQVHAPRLIGRDTELAMLRDRWELACDGEDQFVLLRGDAGIGKSTLLRALVNSVQEGGGGRVMPMFCSAFEGNSAFHPLLEYFLGSDAAGEGRRERLERRIDAAGLPEDSANALRQSLLALAGDAEALATFGRGEIARRELLRCLREFLVASARKGPLLIIIEDVHWADPSTQEFIELLLAGGTGSGIMSLFTSRPDSQLDWASRPDIMRLDLQRLPRRAIERLVRELAGDAELDPALLERVVAETEGNPLFIEELTRAMLEHGETGTALPGTVQQSLESRMNRLGSAEPLLQLCSLLGRQFDYALLRAVSATENEAALQEELRTIVNAGLLFQEGAVPDSRYRFKHMLLQEAARRSLLRGTRREQHGRIAQVIEAQFPEITERQPEVLAYHYCEGEMPDKAVTYWMSACRRSLQSYALREALEQANHGLADLRKLPEGAGRDGLEIGLLALRGKSLLALRGYSDPEVEQTFNRALELSEKLGDAPQLFQLVVGLWMYFFIGGETDHAVALARRLIRIAERDDAPARTLQAHYCLGYALYRLGRFNEARAELERAREAEQHGIDYSAESPSGDDTRIHVRAVMAHVLWMLGEEQAALAQMNESLSLASELGNPYGLVFAEHSCTWLHTLRRDRESVIEHANRTTALAEEKGFLFWLGTAAFMRTWAQQGAALDEAARVARMEECIENHRRHGVCAAITFYSLCLAETLIDAGNLERAQHWLDTANDIADRFGERFVAPEALRIEAAILSARGRHDEACDVAGRALALARDMQAVSFARLAAADLGRYEGAAEGKQAPQHAGNGQERQLRD